MHLRNSAQASGVVAITLHWLVVVVVVLAWLLGTFGDDFPRGAARLAGLFAHISAGLAIIGLLTVRIPRWFVDLPPPLEETPWGEWLGVAGRLTHLASYGLLIATPVVGVVLQFARGGALPIFGLAEIASPWVRDRAFAGSVKEIHETLANILMIVAGLHTAAALTHHWISPRRTLARMLPGLNR